MTTKLTLSIDAKVIEKTKKYAKRHGTSISKLVEEHLTFLTQTHKESERKNPFESLRKIKGIAGPAPDNLNYKNIITDAIIQKHLK